MADRSQHPGQIMENETRYDLNAAIENWRLELAAQPNLASDDRRELETHLRDTIAELRRRGLNDEESFVLARHRVGQPQKLADEFVKENPAKIWRERVLWICFAGFLLNALENTINSINMAMMPVRTGSFYDWIGGPEILFMLQILIPLILALALASGKMIPLFSKLTLLIGSRLRFAITSLVVIAITTGVSLSATFMYNARINYPTVHNFSVSYWQEVYFSCFHKLIFALLIIWLIPTQNQKTSKHV